MPVPYCEGQQNYPQMKQPKDNCGGPSDKGKRRSRVKAADTVDMSGRSERQSYCKPAIPSNANVTRMSSNGQSGNQNTCTPKLNSSSMRSQSQEQSFPPNHTLKVANLETLVIQPGSPTVIEVRSGGRQSKCLSNGSDTNETDTNYSEAESSCGGEPVNDDTEDGPSNYCRPPENQCNENSKAEDANMCKQNLSVQEEASGTIRGPRKDCSTNRSQRSSMSNVDGQKPPEGMPEKGRRMSNGRPPCSPVRRPSADKQGSYRQNCLSWQAPLANQAQELNKGAASPEANDSGNRVSMSCSSNRANKVSRNSSNASRQISSTSNSQRQKCNRDSFTTENMLENDEQLNHTLTVSNLDTLVIQPGSPTLIQVRQSRAAKDVQQECEQEQQKVETKNENECEKDIDQIPDGGGKLSKCQEYTNVKESLNNIKTGCSDKQSKTKRVSGYRNNQKTCPNEQYQEQPQQYPAYPQYQNAQPTGFQCPDQKVMDFNQKAQAGRTPQIFKKPSNQMNYSNGRQKQMLPPITPLYPNVAPCQMAPSYVSPQYQSSPQTEYQYASQLAPQGQQNSRICKPYATENMIYQQLPVLQQQAAQLQALSQQYQQYLCPPSMSKQVQAYDAQYQAPQQCVDYQQMQPYDQASPMQYQNDCGYGNDQQCDASVYSDTQCSEDYNAPENYGEQRNSQLNNYETNTAANLYYQGNQNYVTPNYYDCCAYE